MTEQPQTGPGPAETRPAPEKPLGENAILKFVQRPRIMLILLAVWSLIGFLTEVFVNTGLFVEDHRGNGDIDLDGAFAGLALGWQSLPLAVLYGYCARDPMRYQRIFWLALIHMAALVAANFYQWLGRETLTFESAVIPLAVSGGLGTLVFLHLFQPREDESPARAAVGD